MQDKELADKVVALGVGEIDIHMKLFPYGLADTDGGNHSWNEAELFIRDPRVAMALMEKCISNPLSFAIREDEVNIASLQYDRGAWHYGGGVSNVMIDESLPRAITEACTEALGAKDE